MCAVKQITTIIGNSASMHEVRHAVQVAARCNSTVLITGESGTGKELVAQTIHNLSVRASAPMVAINCGAFSETLLDSELFGYVKGAFTGATSDRPGLIRAAHMGTLFLDEFGELTSATQVRLLRVLQERKVRPVGATPAQELAVDVRIIAATNRDLEADIAAGIFRRDLFYRVNVLNIHLPPLRARREDIPQLTSALVQKMQQRGVWPQELHLEDGAVDALCAHTWPGNVRELENILERLAATCGDASRVTLHDVRGALTVEIRPLCSVPSVETPAVEETISRADLIHVPPYNVGEKPGIFLARSFLFIYKTLMQRHGNSHGRVAKLMHIHRNNLYRRVATEQKHLSEHPQDVLPSSTENALPAAFDFPCTPHAS